MTCAFLGQGLLDIGFNEIAVIINIVDFPDDIITETQAIKNFVKAAESGCHPPVGHDLPFFRFKKIYVEHLSVKLKNAGSPVRGISPISILYFLPPV